MAGGTIAVTTFDYNGKKAVATGAGGAIGGEIARGLARSLRDRVPSLVSLHLLRGRRRFQAEGSEGPVTSGQPSLLIRF